MKEDIKIILVSSKDSLKKLIKQLEDERDSQDYSLINQVKLLRQIKTNTKSFIDFIERTKLL